MQLNINRLHAILAQCTMMLRKGPEVTHELVSGVEVTEIFNMPHVSEVTNSDLEIIDLVFVAVGVRKSIAESFKEELLGLLDDWPDEAPLEDGPSYITTGAVIGDQGAALSLYALGKSVGFWRLFTPESLKVEGEEADDLARRGLIMTKGYHRRDRPTPKPAPDGDQHAVGA